MIKDLMPWQKIGRWYHVRLISDGKKVTVESSDLKVSYASPHLVIEELLVILDYRIDFKRRKFKDSVEFQPKITYTAKNVTLNIIPANAFEKMDIFIFGKMEG